MKNVVMAEIKSVFYTGKMFIINTLNNKGWSRQEFLVCDAAQIVNFELLPETANSGLRKINSINCANQSGTKLLFCLRSLLLL